MTVKLPDVQWQKDSIYDWEELCWDRDRDWLPSLVYKKRRKVGVEEREGTVVTVRQ